MKSEASIKRWEWALLALAVGVGAWLRMSRLDLLEFGSDQTIAAMLALKFVKHGVLPLAGLMSSVGVTNPPLFIYLLIPMFAITTDVALVSCMIAILSLGAVVACWHIGRTYYGKVTGLAAAAMFAVSPWAIIYSRKIWAQDFIPILATATMWAVHALVLGKKPKAVFWVVLLPLCVVQIHFSGLAFSLAVLTILLVLRPRVSWRYAIAGVGIALLSLAPYVVYQTKNDWQDFRHAFHTIGGQDWKIPRGMTIQPGSGFLLPRREYWIHALAIMNAGEIEDVLGLSTDRRFDLYGIYAENQPGQHPYFSQTLTLGESVLNLQRWLFVGVTVYLVVVGVCAVRRTGRFPFLCVRAEPGGQRAWILVLWMVMPLAVYSAARLWTYLSYFVILYPAHFLALGFLVDLAMSKAHGKGGRAVVAGAFGVVLIWNVVFMTDFYRFVGKLGGAHGTYCTVLGSKREAAHFLAMRVDANRLMAEGRLIQLMDEQINKARPAEVELPFLAMQDMIKAVPNAIPTNAMVVVVDENRSPFNAAQWQQLNSLPHTNFGPLRLYFATR